jgi:3-deoxy-D-manno-octulosonate 8-phosphate phosphatase (KDO 8-P phosphatase)
MIGHLDPAVVARARPIRLVAFDVDGVLTDGTLYLADSGEEYKAFHARDGFGLRLLAEGGIERAVITGRRSSVVAHRMRDLEIDHVYQGQRNKGPAYEYLLETTGLSPESIAYVGDDLVDVPVLKRVGLAITVADAHPVATRYAHWQTVYGGGHGAVREVCELILAAQGKLDSVLAPYLG